MELQTVRYCGTSIVFVMHFGWQQIVQVFNPQTEHGPWGAISSDTTGADAWFG
jgi:hypothetical protein